MEKVEKEIKKTKKKNRKQNKNKGMKGFFSCCFFLRYRKRKLG